MEVLLFNCLSLTQMSSTCEDQAFSPQKFGEFPISGPHKHMNARSHTPETTF